MTHQRIENPRRTDTLDKTAPSFQTKFEMGLIFVLKKLYHKIMSTTYVVFITMMSHQDYRKIRTKIHKNQGQRKSKRGRVLETVTKTDPEKKIIIFSTLINIIQSIQQSDQCALSTS